MTRKSIKYRFDNGRGQSLAATLDTPDAEPLFYAVFAPCFTCPKESHGAAKTSRALAELGVACVRIDLTGLGESEGDFAETNFTTRVADILAACKAVEKDYAAPALLIGHSISGTACLAAAKSLPPSLQAIATIGAPADPAHIIEKFKRQNAITPRGDMVDIMVMGTKVTFRNTFINDMLAQNVESDTKAIDRRLFIFHAPHDNVVSMENAELIYDRASSNPAGDVELIRLDDAATHLFENRKEDANFVAATLADWFRMHLK